MKIYQAIFALLASLYCLPAFGVSRPFSQIWSFNNSAQKTISVQWYQTESLVFDLYSTTSGVRMDLSATNLVPVWDVTAWTNRTIAYLAVTGTIINATNGHIRYTVTPAESNLEPGDYAGYMRLLGLSGTNITELGVLAKQSIEVLGAADSRQYTYRGPLTYDPGQATNALLLQGLAWGDATTNTLTNIAWSSFGGGSSCTETDPVWTAASTGYYTRTQSEGRYSLTSHVHSIYATGTPLYAYTETDPAWQAGTGAIWTAINAGGVTAGVSQLIAGTGVTLDPTSGVGAVTIAASGGSSGMDPAIASNSFVDVAGDTMTGALTINCQDTIMRILSTNSSLSIGNGAINTGSVNVSIGNTAKALNNEGVAIGYLANAVSAGSVALGPRTVAPGNYDVAIGYNANAGGQGVAIGQAANGKGGAALGYAANAGGSTLLQGVAIGAYANCGESGTAVGGFAGVGVLAENYGFAGGVAAQGTNNAIAIGRSSRAGTYGIGIGRSANGQNGNVAIGVRTVASSGAGRTAIGPDLTNSIDESAMLRGSLYLDGATTLVFRSTFGSGEWNVGLQTETGRLYSINSEGTRTLISPHDPATGESILLSENPYAGERVTINLERIAYALEAMGHTGLIERTAITKRDWSAEQADRVAARLAEIAAWDKARADAIKAEDAWDATPAKDREGQDRPTVPDLSSRPPEYTPKTCPDWITRAGQKEKE